MTQMKIQRFQAAHRSKKLSNTQIGKIFRSRNSYKYLQDFRVIDHSKLIQTIQSRTQTFKVVEKDEANDTNTSRNIVTAIAPADHWRLDLQLVDRNSAALRTD